jgi:hypothetical protein
MDFDNFTNIDTINSSIIYITPQLIETFILPAGLIFGVAGFILCCCSQFRLGGKRESFSIVTTPIKADTPPKYSEERYFRPIQSNNLEQITPQVYNTFTYVKNLE